MSNAAVNLGPNSSSLVGSGNVGGSPISFRGITFTSLEHPSTFGIGGIEGLVVVKKLPGGSLITNGMGAHPQPLSIVATIFGQNNVGLKVSLLAAYAADQQEGILSWAGEKWYARAQKLTPAYVHEWRAGFTLDLVVTRSANGSSLAQSPAYDADLSLDDTLGAAQDQISGLYTSVTTTAQQTAVESVDTAAQNAVSIRTGVGSLSGASASDIASVSGAIGSALSASAPLQSLFAGATDGSIASTRLMSLLTIAQATVSQGQAQNTVTLRGGDLFGLAAQTTGDPSNAFAIADLNGLSSVFLPANVSTTIRLLGSAG